MSFPESYLNRSMDLEERSAVLQGFCRALGSVLVCIFVVGIMIGCKSQLDSRGRGNKPSPAQSGGEQGKRTGCLNIVNGAATSDHSAVTLLLSRDNKGKTFSCTGTYVGPNTILTAAHCIPVGMENDLRIFAAPQLDIGRTPEQTAAVFQSGIKPRKIIVKSMDIVTGGGDTLSSKQVFRDLALLILHERINAPVYPMAKSPPTAGSEAILVGYGLKTLTDHAATDSRKIRQYGRNRIQEYSTEKSAIVGASFPNAIRIVGESDEKGSPAEGRSLTGSGDSGGPLLVNHLVVGVASTGGETPAALPAELKKIFPEPYGSVYATTYSDEAKTLLAEAKAAGAEISEPGVPTAAAGSSGAVNCLQ